MPSKRSRVMLIWSVVNFSYAIWRCIRAVTPHTVKLKTKTK